MRDRDIVRLLVLVIGMLAAEPASPALLAWEKGQEALRQGQTEQAITHFRQSLQLDPTLARNHLSLAAAYVGKGLDAQAVPHFALYLAAQPDHLVVRAHYAEVLWRLGQLPAARTQWERFITEIQDHPELASQHLVHSHSRLMEIAEVEDDEYSEHLHRGIGLFLLGCQRAAQSDPQSQKDAESLLVKAAGELMLARAKRAEEARPCWYLHEVWSQLAQSQPAARWLHRAAAAAPYSYLTPAERRALQLAIRQSEQEKLRKP
jgi:tetratricopeptide (TPR) repeat protein